MRAHWRRRPASSRLTCTKAGKSRIIRDFRTLLQAVKAIGANRVGAGRRSGLLGRAAFRRAEMACETLRTPAGLPLTYDVITLYAHA